MSSRALRRLQGDADIVIPQLREDLGDGEVDLKALTDANGRSVVNRFDALITEDPEDANLDGKENQEEHLDSPERTEVDKKDGVLLPQSKGAGAKKKKKKKKKKTKIEEKNELHKLEEDEIDVSVREVNRILGDAGYGLSEVTNQKTCCIGAFADSTKSLLNVEHRHLNPENELKRIFGSKVIQGDQSHKRNRSQGFTRAGRLAQRKPSWPHLGKTGLSMVSLSTQNGCQSFTFEHNHSYQQVQFEFLDAVESLNPQNIMNVIQEHPYHIDSLLQLSDVCRMSGDMQMCTELVERALYGFENSFHPLFSLTRGDCRLDYRHPENRSFFLALLKHLSYCGQKGCYRTALEYSKLLLSFDPDTDPLGILLLIDFYAVRAGEFSFLLRMFEEWEPHRNLSQLPNFAFSVPLAMYHQAIQNEQSTSRADEMLQRSLMMFPGLLQPLLNQCGVSPNSAVAGHPYFGLAAQSSQPNALKQLVALYVNRTWSCWKDAQVMHWLEVNVHQMLQKTDEDPLMKEYSEKRQIRYQGTPRNIYRHIILSEVKDAMTALPPDITSMPVLSHDPLPPADSIVSYTRPPKNRRVDESTTLTNFFRSLLPNFDIDEPIAEALGATGGELGSNRLAQGIGALMDAMRDLLDNIRPVEPPVENQHDDNNNEEEENDNEWNVDA